MPIDTNTGPKPKKEESPRSPDPAQRALEYLKQVAEVHKARMTWHTALASITVALTGYGLQTRSYAIFFLAAAVPVFQFASDYFIKQAVTCPLVYKALMCDLSSDDKEPLTLLMLDFSFGPDSQFMQLRDNPDDGKRRTAFRKMYMKKRIGLKVGLFAAISMIEVILAFCYRAHPR